MFGTNQCYDHFTHSSWKSISCLLQVGDLQEEEDRVRQLSGERGAEGGHHLLPPNDRGQRSQLGHLRKDGGSVWEDGVRQIERSQSCLTCSVGKPLEEVVCTPKCSLRRPPERSRRAETLQCLELWLYVSKKIVFLCVCVCPKRRTVGGCELKTECQWDICSHLFSEVECSS